MSRNSRYLRTPLVLDDDQKLRHIEWQPPRYGIVEQEGLYVVTSGDLYRPDLISYANYGVSDLWWLILHYNGVVNPFGLEVGDRLRIPGIATVNKVLADTLRGVETRTILPATLPSVPKLRIFKTLPYNRPTLPSELEGAEDPLGSDDDTLFIYGFKVPAGLEGDVHFQVVASTSNGFTPLALNKFTMNAQDRWFFYNPSAQSGAGAYQAFPEDGIDGELYEGQTVYYSIGVADGLVPGVEYFVRYRSWVDNVESAWIVGPPIIIPND